MVWLTVPAGRDEVTTQWLSSVFGPVQSFTIEQIGEDFGLSGSTFKVDLRLIDAPLRQAAIKFVSSGPTAREIGFFEHCAGGHAPSFTRVRGMSVASQEIVLALFDLLAGTINWLGRTPPDPPDSRKEALGRNMLDNITVTLEAFTMGDGGVFPHRPTLGSHNAPFQECPVSAHPARPWGTQIAGYAWVKQVVPALAREPHALVPVDLLRGAHPVGRLWSRG